jgi:alpha-glucosidase (family GH31 glycosyl hydrolase)
LFFEFPTEGPTLAIDQQFLVGPAFLVTPVTTQGATSVQAYLPTGAIWYAREGNISGMGVWMGWGMFLCRWRVIFF